MLKCFPDYQQMYYYNVKYVLHIILVLCYEQNGYAQIWLKTNWRCLGHIIFTLHFSSYFFSKCFWQFVSFYQNVVHIKTSQHNCKPVFLIQSFIFAICIKNRIIYVKCVTYHCVDLYFYFYGWCFGIYYRQPFFKWYHLIFPSLFSTLVSW